MEDQVIKLYAVPTGLGLDYWIRSDTSKGSPTHPDNNHGGPIRFANKQELTRFCQAILEGRDANHAEACLNWTGRDNKVYFYSPRANSTATLFDKAVIIEFAKRTLAEFLASDKNVDTSTATPVS